MRIIQSANPRPLNVLAVSPGGLVAAASADGNVPKDVEVFDALSGARVFNYPLPYSRAGGLAFTPDGGRLLVGERGAVVMSFDVATWAAAAGPSVTLNNPEFAAAADGTALLVVSQYTNRIGCAVELVALRPPYPRLWADGPRGDLWYAAPALDPAGGRFALAVRGFGPRPTQSVSVGDAGTGAALVAIPFDPADPVRRLAFTAGGSELLVSTDDRIVRVFDARTGAPAGPLVHKGRSYVTGLAVHPGGPVACARTDGTVTLWDPRSWEQLRTLDWEAGRLMSVAFSPDGALGAAGTEDGKVVVWDVDL